MDVDLEAIAAEVEGTDGEIPGALAEKISAILSTVQPNQRIAPDALRSTDAILHMTDEIVPGWSIHLRGRAIEPNGHWACALRRTDERDNDEFIGHGHAPVLSAAILAATLRTLEFQMKRKQIGG